MLRRRYSSIPAAEAELEENDLWFCVSVRTAAEPQAALPLYTQRNNTPPLGMFFKSKGDRQIGPGSY
jgi:hypothetical protein